MTQIGSLKVVNPTKYTRADVVVRRLPMRQGQIVKMPEGRTYRTSDGDPCIVKLAPMTMQHPADDDPHGERDVVPRYPDGSARALDVVAPVVVDGESTVTLGIEERVGNDAEVGPFTLSQSVTNSLLGFVFALRIDGRIVPFEWQQAGSERLFARFVLSVRDVATGFWADVFLRLNSHLDHAPFSLRTGWSDETNPSVNLEAGPRIELVVRGAAIRWQYEDVRLHQPRIEGPDVVSVIEPGGGRWGDGQSVEASGVLIFLERTNEAEGPPIPFAKASSEPRLRLYTRLAEHDAPLLSIGIGWKAQRAYGPFGVVPSSGQVLLAEAAKARAIAWWRALPRQHGPWAHGQHACNPTPADTGDQADFGVAQLYEAAESEEPALLLPVRLSVGQESCRPCGPRERNAQRVTHAGHPAWFCWARITHYDASVSRDQRGKTPGQWRRQRAEPRHGREWWGHDRQHNSVLYLAALLQLTGDPRVFDLAEDWTEQYLAEHPVLGTGSILESLGAPRGLGRTSLSAAWIYTSTGARRLLDRLRERWRRNVVNLWHSRANLAGMMSAVTPITDDHTEAAALVPAMLPCGPCLHEDESAEFARVAIPGGGFADVPITGPMVAAAGTPLSVFGVSGPDPRALPVPFWAPWQESFACLGGAAVYRLTKEPTILPILRLVLRTIAMHSVHYNADTKTWDVASYLAWNDGQPLPAEAWSDPARVQVYNAFRKWMVPALQLGNELAVHLQDAEWMQRCTDVLLSWGATPDRGTWDQLTPWLGATFGDSIESTT